MRTETADFFSPGMKATARAGLDRAGDARSGEPKERFALPPETDDRKAARAAPASRADGPPARGREAPAGKGADPAIVAAARALDRAAPQSALRRGDADAQPDIALPEALPALEGDPAATALSLGAVLEAVTQAQSEPSIADAPVVPAEGDPAPSAPVAAIPLVASDETSEEIAEEDASENDAPQDAPQDAPPPVSGLDREAAQAAPVDEDAEPVEEREAVAILAALVPPAAPAAPESEDGPVVAEDGEVSPAELPDGWAAAAGANGAAIADLARDKSIDGRSVAEAARAMRGPFAMNAQTAGTAPGTQSTDEAGFETGGESAEDGDAVQVARNDAASPSAVDLDDMRARLTPNGAGDRNVGLPGLGAGATEASDAGSENAARGLQQTASSQSAALQAEAARAAAEAGRPTIVVPQTAMAAVPMAIGLKALNGVSNFQIRLDPAELGRIDVSLEIDGEGNVNAKLVVDRVETLQLLQRDARTLERAFEQAGLKPSDGGIDLSLRDPGGERRNGREGFDEQRGNAYGRAGGSGEENVAVDPRAPAALAAQAALRRALGGVDLRI